MAWERTALTIVLIFIQNLLIGLKLDDAIHNSWWVVFIPAYTWVGIVLIIVTLAWYNLNSAESRGSWMSGRRALYFTILAACVITLVVLIAVRAENGSNPPWPVVFIPVYVYLLLLLVVIVFYYGDDSDTSSDDSIYWLWLQWYWLLNLFAYGVLLFIFLAIKLGEGLHSWNYWAVLSPLWVLAVTAALLFTSSIPLVISGRLPISSWKLCFCIAAYCSIVVFLVFLTLRADSSIHWDWSLVFLPLYILEFLTFLYVVSEWLDEPNAYQLSQTTDADY